METNVDSFDATTTRSASLEQAVNRMAVEAASDSTLIGDMDWKLPLISVYVNRNIPKGERRVNRACTASKARKLP